VTELHWDSALAAGWPPSRRFLAQRGERHAYRVGTILINEGDRGSSLFVVLRGRLKVFSINSDGHEITYGILEPGDIFGEMSLDGGPRSASVMALETCTCAVLSRAVVRRYVRANPEFALELINVVIHRARTATRVARGLALDSAYRRLATFLELEARPATAGALPSIRHYTHLEIASRIGTSRETVTRLLKELSQSGSISVNRYTLTLLKVLPERL
jgi:CRP/FNR family cyclic AMP-dependent transcriptional regulator